MFKQKSVVDTIAFSLPLLFVILLYAPVLFHPSSYMFDIEGDGVKNYYTLAWFVEHNIDWIQHSAMKYPYGEHYLYTDGFVPFGWLFKILGVKAVAALGFVNFLMVFSLVPTAFFSHKILQYFRVRPLASVIGGFAIAVLAPQLPRLTGHYALGLSFFFVISFWLYLNYLKSANWRRAFWMFFNALFWLFIHPYLGIMVVMFYALVFGYRIVFARASTSARWYVQGFFYSVLPLLVFKVFLMFTDIHPMRPEKPWGFWLFTANYKSILLPNKGPFSGFIKKTIGFEGVSWETFSYIGISSMIILLIYLTRLLLKKEKSTNELQKSWRPFLFSSLVLLILSFGIPFVWEPRLADIFSPIRNFRVLGRFAWVFYYVITLFSVYKLDQWLSNTQRWTSIMQQAIILFFLGIMIFEGVESHSKMAAKIQVSPNYFDAHNLPKEMTELISHINSNEYLAILPLPFYHLGTYGIAPQGDALFSSMLISFHTGLPLIANDLPRTSIVENKKSILVTAPGFYPKPLFDDMPKSGKILLLQSSGKLTQEEQEIIDRSQKLVGNKKYVFSELDIARLKEPNFEKYLKVHAEEQNTSDQPWRYQATHDSLLFDKEYNILVDFSKEERWKAGKYALSLWYKNPFNDRLSSSIFLEEKNEDTGKVKWLNSVSLGEGVLVAGDSIRSELHFTLEASARNKYRLIYKNPKLDIPRLDILNWLVRNTEIDVVMDGEHGRKVNNHIEVNYRMLGLDSLSTLKE